jgi:PAS domain S-box-containing protein
MNPLLNKLFCPRHIEYLVVDQDLNIQEKSWGVHRFSDSPQDVIQGKNVRLGFPELIGIEDLLNQIIQEQQPGFELKGIGRFSERGEPLYLDIYITKNYYGKTLDKQLLIFLEDVSEKMILEQSLVQRTNEAALLLDAWGASNDYLDKIISSMAEALLVTTPKGIIKTINLASQELFGYSDEELIGQSISLITNQENLLRQASQNYLLLKQQSNNHVEVICQTKAGEKIILTFSCSAIQTEAEKLQYFIYVAKNIPEYHHNHKHLNTDCPKTYVNLSGANLSSCFLSGCSLSGANLSGANLSNTDLSNADLSNTDLSNTDLSNTDLSNANLSGANLSGAKVQNAKFGDNLGISEETKSDLRKRGAIFED